MFRRLLSRHAAPVALAVGILLAGCGSAGSAPSQVRTVVEQYLTARTPAQRCALFTTVFRTMNPEVLLAGGCERSEQLSSAGLTALRSLRIEQVQVRDRHATVVLTPVRGAASDGRGSTTTPALTGIDLTIERGKWRIDGFSERSQGDTGTKP